MRCVRGAVDLVERRSTNCRESRIGVPEAEEEVGNDQGDMFWGDRYGVVTDPFGHSWSFATHIRDLTPAEMEAGMQEAFAQQP